MIHETIDLVPAIARIVAMSLAAATVAAATAFAFRWYSGSSIPDGVPILIGVSVVATALNTTATLQRSLAADQLVGEGAAGFTLTAFAAGAIAADVGRRSGEHLARDFPTVHAVRGIETDVGSIVRSRGRVTRVHVPETIADIDGYEPVPREVKEDLAGTTFVFPRRITVGDLRERFVERLKRDYEVGHVDVELAEDGTVEYLALGRRLAGLGQTLAPGTVAVAIRADPALTATPGDRVQIWRDPVGAEGDPDAATTAASAADAADTESEPPQPTQVATGELRAAVDDIATVAVDAADADALDDRERYRLVTLPASVQPDREFAALLRNADETMGSIEIASGSDLEGTLVDDVDLTVAALKSDGNVTAIPAGDRALASGETIYVVGRPEGIRRLEARAGPGGSAESGDEADEPAPGGAEDD